MVQLYDGDGFYGILLLVHWTSSGIILSISGKDNHCILWIWRLLRSPWFVRLITVGLIKISTKKVGVKVKNSAYLCKERGSPPNDRWSFTSWMWLTWGLFDSVNEMTLFQVLSLYQSIIDSWPEIGTWMCVQIKEIDQREVSPGRLAFGSKITYIKHELGIIIEPNLNSELGITEIILRTRVKIMQMSFFYLDYW